MKVNKGTAFKAKMVHIRRGMNTTLAEKFGCSQAFISKCLSFALMSEKARRIRDYAANRMGYVVMTT